MKFVIEHLEPQLYPWCLIEYGHICKIVGKNNVVFTNIKNKKGLDKLKKYSTAHTESISKLNFSNICVLSHHSKRILTSSDKNRFDYFVFGGILGDSPAKKRTNILVSSLRKSKVRFETRSLGNKQMPTDVAVYVANKMLSGGKLCDLKFADELEIEVNGNESAVLPFRYALENNRLVIDEKLVDYIRKRKEF